MPNNLPIIEFNPKLPKLSKNEKEVLKLLVEAAKLIVPIYQKQEELAEKGLSKEDIEKEAKKNPEILSPFTLVEKLEGRIVVTPYHVKFANLLLPVAEKLEEAAKISSNKKFSNALKIQAKALLNGEYEKATATWLKMKPYIFDIAIGPLEYHSAELLFSKASYQAWVGVLDKDGTGRLNRYKKIVLTVRRKALLSGERIDNLEHVKAKTIDVLLFVGFMARTKFIGVNLPIDVNWVEKYGSEITIFNQPNDQRMSEQILPMFQKIFSSSFRQGYNLEDLRRGNLRQIALHELAHSYLYYKNAAKNLEDLFTCVYELAATILGLRMAGSLHLEEVITSKQLESMVVTYICRSAYLFKKVKSDKIMTNHMLGGSIFINFLKEGGAIKMKGDVIVPNFMKIFISLQELLFILEKLLSSGSRKDAENFLRKYLR